MPALKASISSGWQRFVGFISLVAKVCTRVKTAGRIAIFGCKCASEHHSGISVCEPVPTNRLPGKPYVFAGSTTFVTPESIMGRIELRHLGEQFDRHAIPMHPVVLVHLPDPDAARED